MNKYNFGRVIKRIENHPDLWVQGGVPSNDKTACGSPYCFMGHAEFIRTKGKSIEPPGFDRFEQTYSADCPLLTWLGISRTEAHRIYWASGADSSTFKAWHEAGEVL
jgi:hypothetical protein